jgi:hypothetical protein
MALSKQAVETAHKLLLKIGGTNRYIREYHKDEKHPHNTVMGTITMVMAGRMSLWMSRTSHLNN